MRNQGKQDTDCSEFLNSYVNKLFPGILDDLDEQEANTFVRKIQVAVMSHLNSDYYPVLKYLCEKDFKIYRDASFKWSNKSQDKKLEHVVFAFMTRFF